MTTASGTRELLEPGRPFHFVGIGGEGMSALAEILLARGRSVSGCDLRSGRSFERLARLGAEVHRGHDAAHLDAGALVVVSSAVPATNEELERARERGQPVVRRAELLGALMAGSRGIAVAGTHGKSTTTTMVGSILGAAGLDPTVVVGGRIRGGESNVRIGNGEWFVAEADEYDRSFLSLSPEIAVITNIEEDHLDTYGTLDGVREAFADFAERVSEGGAIVVGLDDPEVRRLVLPSDPAVVTFGIESSAEVEAGKIVEAGLESRFPLRLGGVVAGEVTLRIPGRHNVKNALAAAAVGWRIGVDPAAIVAALSSVRGVGRRFEIVRRDEGVTIVDDYAHHPTEVAATLAGMRQAWPEARLVAVFQPHLYSRTRDFAGAFGKALAAADVVFVTGVYPAREDPIEGVTGKLVSEAARTAGSDDVTFLSNSEAFGEIVGRLEPGDVVVTLGAGDIDRLARRLASELSRPDAPVGMSREGEEGFS